jgi:hypothetical protein
MGKDTLQTLTEVKMHICDEHLSQNEMKNILKCHFWTVDLSSTSLPTLPSNEVDVMGSSDTPSSPRITSDSIDFCDTTTELATEATPAATSCQG